MLAGSVDYCVVCDLRRMKINQRFGHGDRLWKTTTPRLQMNISAVSELVLVNYAAASGGNASWPQDAATIVEANFLLET